jgi:hypothetical protein
MHFLDKNNHDDLSSKILITQIKEIQNIKLKKNSQKRKTIIQKMKNQRLIK